MPVYGTPPETQETNNPALHDHAVRLAIAHAIDKEQIAQVVFQGAAQPADTFISPDKAFWHLDIPADEEYDFNLDEANQILDDAGYTERTPDGVRIDPKTGDPLVLDILTITNSRGSVKTGELMAGWMDEIGIEFDLRPVSEPKAYVEWENGDVRRLHLELGRRPGSRLQHVRSTSRASASDGATGAIATPSSTSCTTSRGRRSTATSGKRLVAGFERIHYEDIPEIVLVYPRADLTPTAPTRSRDTCPRPTNGGAFLFGWRVDSYMQPEAGCGGGANGPVADEGGISTGLLIVIGAIVVIVGRGVRR